ncbi:MAG TPA: M48 family metalloprotease [Blastocatellia bacterium]|nr:M48 family metalloprotease [Blastocatellia bacterium]
MAMNPERFDAHVRRLEELAARSPGTYKFRVFMLALLGYAYIFAVIGVVLTLGGGIVWAMVTKGVGLNWLVLKAAIALLALGGIILRALWVKLSPPEGIRLYRKDEEALFDMIDYIQGTLRAPKAHVVLLNDDFNASISQLPRLGVFGWHRNYLTIGLPLLQALSPKQFQAVLAHEFGHLSGAHGRFSSWVYRVRISWFQLMVRLETQEHWGSFIFARFFEWYAPYFSAYSFVLARAQEYEADRLAAEISGSGNVSDMLVKLEVSGAFFQEEFWPSLYRRANDEDRPSPAPYTEMQIELYSGMRPDKAQKWLNYALSVQTNSLDTHPSLSARLSALGQKPGLPEPAEQSAAEYFLKKSLVKHTSTLNTNWNVRIAEAWKERYRYAQESQNSLRELEEKARREPLTVEEAWKRAALTEEFRDTQAAFSLYQKVLDLKPEHAEALFSVGRILLSRDEAGGIDYIKRAMRLDRDLSYPGCQVVCSFLIENGREEEAKVFYESSLSQPPRFSQAG